MKTYFFETSVTMREEDKGKWWIDGNIIGNKWIYAETVKEAIERFAEVSGKCGVDISKNAIRCKSPMYIDKENGEVAQVGYVIIGKTMFDNDRGNWIDKYVEIWVTINEAEIPDFEEEIK